MLQNTGERLLPWELQYPQNHYEHLQRYYFAAQFAAGRRVLDLGSGEGYGADILAVAAKEVVGVDISPEVVEWANHKYSRPNLKYLCGSATDIPIEGESMLDLVVCFEMIEHIADQQAILREAKRLLKPEGLLIVSTPNKSVYSDEHSYKNPFHVRELYIPEFRRLIETFFPHASYLGQRVHSAAAMWPLEGGAAKAYEIAVERAKDGFVPADAAHKVPMYVVAVASQQRLHVEVQKTNTSYFFLLDVSDTLVKRLCEDAQRNLEVQREEDRSTFEKRWVEAQRDFDERWREAKTREEELRVEIRNAGDKINQLEHRIVELGIESSQLDSQRRSLQVELEALYHSNSWKLASKLRRMKRGVQYLHSAARLLPSALYRRRSRKPLVDLKFAALLSRSGLFDSDFYLQRYPDVASLGIDPVIHYLVMGADEGRDPSPVFSTSFYLERNPDVAQACINPLVHFLVSGGGEGRNPHPLFNTAFYIGRNPDVAQANTNPLLHFLKWGGVEGRDPHPLFSTSFYLRNNPDVARSGVNPLVHYILFGATEGRDPHPHFDSSYYLNQNRDVADARLNPLAHYVGPGIAEGRDPNPYFSTTTYLEQNPEVALKGQNPLVHSLDNRWASRPKTNPSKLDVNSEHLAVRCEAPFTGGGTARRVGDIDRPTVSVIVPCYNHGEYLDEAVQSVLRQTYQDFEIIVVDDGSNDEKTIHILDQFKRPKTRLIRTRNQGLANARNNGIRACQGEYVLPLDADDEIGSTYLEKAVRLLQENERVGIVYCEAEFFGEASGPWDLPPYRFPEILLGNMIFCSAVFRKSDWAEVKGYTACYGWEDFEFWLSLIELGRDVIRIPETLFFYRRRLGSMIATMSREDQAHAYAKLVRRHPKLYLNNIAILLRERPLLWLELERFIHGVEPLKDERLQLAWKVMRELISNSEWFVQPETAESVVGL